MLKDRWQKMHDFMAENKDLLIMIGDPASDEISIGYNELNTFVRFPMESKDHGVLFNALRSSKFSEAIDPLIFGINSAMGMTDEDANQINHVIGGSIKALGAEVKESTLEIINKPKKNASKKGKNSK